MGFGEGSENIDKLTRKIIGVVLVLIALIVKTGFLNLNTLTVQAGEDHSRTVNARYHYVVRADINSYETYDNGEVSYPYENATAGGTINLYLETSVTIYPDESGALYYRTQAAAGSSSGYMHTEASIDETHFNALQWALVEVDVMTESAEGRLSQEGPWHIDVKLNSELYNASVVGYGDDEKYWSVDWCTVSRQKLISAVLEFECPSCTVCYEANGGTGWMDPEAVQYGADYQVRNNNFARKNHTFTGWNTRPDGTGEWYNAEDVRYCYGDIRLYAQWAKEEGFISYYGDGADYYKSFYVGDGTNTFEKNKSAFGDKVFAGWAENGKLFMPGSAVALQSGSTLITSGNESYVVDLNMDCPASGTNIQLWSRFDNHAQRWSFESAGQFGGKSYWIIRNTRNGKVLDAAERTGQDHANVRLWPSNGNDAQLWTLKPAGDGYYYILSKLEGYCLELSEDNAGDGVNIQIGRYCASETQKWRLPYNSRAVYAQWADGITDITYTVMYDANGGKDAPGPQQARYNQNLELSKKVPVRVGHTFLSWNTKSDGSGNQFEPGENVKNLTAEDEAGVVLYAQWRKRGFWLIRAASLQYGASLVRRTELDEEWYRSVGRLGIDELVNLPEELCEQCWVITQAGDIERVK